MSISSVHERYQERQARATPEGRFFTRVFHVVTTDVTTAQVDIFADTSIPNIYDPFPGADDAICKNIASEVFHEDQVQWLVICEYGPRKQVEEGNTHPTDLPAVISFGYQQYRRAVEKAYRATDDVTNPTLPVQNSAGQPFDPPLVDVVSNQVITINRNEKTSAFDPNKAANYKDTLNKNPITVAGVQIAALQGRIRKIGSRTAWDEEGLGYWEVTYEVEVDRKYHVRKPLDIGFYQLDSAGELTSIKDSEGEAVTEPVKLDGAGQELGPGGDPVYGSFQTLFAVDWAPLGLPSSALK